MITSSGQAGQVLLSVPNVLFFLNLSSLPFLRSHSSVVCLHHSSVCHSLKVSLLYSREWHFLSCLYLTPLTPLSLSVSSESTFRGAQRHTCQGHMLPSSVTMSVPISLRGRQMLDIKHLICTVFQRSRETERVPETELSKIVVHLTWFDGEDSLSLSQNTWGCTHSNLFLCAQIF